MLLWIGNNFIQFSSNDQPDIRDSRTVQIGPIFPVRGPNGPDGAGAVDPVGSGEPGAVDLSALYHQYEMVYLL